jgi:hypothetical protein
MAGAPVTSFQRPRAGIYATVDGREYLAESYPENGVVTLVGDNTSDPTLFQPSPDGRWRASVAVDRCDRLDEVTTRATYQGHECQVLAMAVDGSVGLHYLGPDKSKAARDGFVQTEPGVWARTVNVFELHDLWEHHADLLFAATFGARSH